MKIIKNKYIQIISTFILIVGITFTVNYFTKPVMASDELTKGEFNNTMEKINEEYSELKQLIENQQIEINELKTENNDLKTLLKKTDSKVEEINTDVKKINKWYDYSKEIYSPLGTSGYYGNLDYIRSKFIEFFK